MIVGHRRYRQTPTTTTLPSTACCSRSFDNIEVNWQPSVAVQTADIADPVLSLTRQ